MSWGIAESASDFEKIRAKSSDYLDGLNSCGAIDYGDYSYAWDFYHDLLEEAYELGKKESRFAWIPCGERLPETVGEYVVTVLSNPGKNRISTTLFYHNGWWIGREKINSVIAWREKPEPYKGAYDETY